MRRTPNTSPNPWTAQPEPQASPLVLIFAWSDAAGVVRSSVVAPPLSAWCAAGQPALAVVAIQLRLVTPTGQFGPWPLTAVSLTTFRLVRISTTTP